jgi:hypothetical protein
VGRSPDFAGERAWPRPVVVIKPFFSLPCIRHLPLANSLQRIGKHTAFAKGECICHSLQRNGFADFNAKANGK